METKIGIENLKKIVKTVATIANTVGSVSDDGKIRVDDFPSMLSGIYHIYDEIKDCDFSLIMEEFNDLDPAEQQELRELFIDRFDIPQNDAEKVVAKILLGSMYMIPAIIDLISFTKNKLI